MDELNGNPLNVELGDTIYWESSSHLEAGSGVVVDMDTSGDDGESYLVSVTGDSGYNRWVPNASLVTPSIGFKDIRSGDRIKIVDPYGNFMTGVVGELDGETFKFAGGPEAHWWEVEPTDQFFILERAKPQKLVVDEAKLNIELRKALTNASNYPASVTPLVLGADLSKLIDAVLAAVESAKVEE